MSRGKFFGFDALIAHAPEAIEKYFQYLICMHYTMKNRTASFKNTQIREFRIMYKIQAIYILKYNIRLCLTISGPDIDLVVSVTSKGGSSQACEQSNKNSRDE